VAPQPLPTQPIEPAPTSGVPAPSPAAEGAVDAADADDTDDTDDTDAPIESQPVDAAVETDVPFEWMGPPLPPMWLTTPTADPHDDTDVPADVDPHADDAPDTDAHAPDAPDAHGTDAHDTDTHVGEHDATAAPSDPDAPDPHAVADADPTHVGPTSAIDDREERASIQRWLDHLLPSLRLRGMRWAVFLSLLALLAWAAARGLDPVREMLAPNGVLPALSSSLQQALRLAAVFLGLGVVAAIIPADIAPALPFVVLTGAIAIGWSVRDLVPDLLAGMVITAERRIRPDRWISTREVAGVVETIALRVTWVRDATGRRIAIPNRMLIREAIITDRGQWPTVELVVRVPEGHAPSEVRRVVQDAILVSPWAAPVGAEMVNEEPEPGRWRVRARVLEGRFADRFEGALREHVEEVLTKGTRLRE
jgi:hypothetical protein